MVSIKISKATKAKIEEIQDQLLLLKKNICQSELLEKIVLGALEDPDFMAQILVLDQVPSVEEKKKIKISLSSEAVLAPAPLLFEEEWID